MQVKWLFEKTDCYKGILWKKEISEMCHNTVTVTVISRDKF